MQYLKENVRERIVTSALDEFAENGYNNSSMRSIAKRADVTVGNIYRYFKNKEDLLDVCLQPIIATIDEVVNSDFELGKKMNGKLDNLMIHKTIANNISKLYVNHHKEFLVLRGGLQGTWYNKYYDELVENVSKKIRRVGNMVIDNFDSLNPMIFDIIARNQIESIIYILDNSDVSESEEIIGQFLSLTMKVFE